MVEGGVGWGRGVSFKVEIFLTLLQIVGGLYDSRNFEQKQLKRPKVKMFLFLDLFLTKCVITIFC